METMGKREGFLSCHSRVRNQ